MFSPTSRKIFTIVAVTLAVIVSVAYHGHRFL